MKRRTKKKNRNSDAGFARFIVECVEKKHPAMMVLDPEDYHVLSKKEQKEANAIARAMNESIFEKDKTAYVSQLRERFGSACIKRILSDMRPSDGWVGHVETGSLPKGKGKSLYSDRLDKYYPDTNEHFQPGSGADVGSPASY